MKRHNPVLRTFAIAFGSVALASSVFAGPPLLCHPYDIGSARSLPWNDAAGWTGTRADYKLENLVADTDALLTPTTPVVVRMETLRRAAIYASMDAKVAKQLADDRQKKLLIGYGTLYRALNRLEDMGLLESHPEDPEIAARERRPGRRLYRLTEAGMEKVRELPARVSRKWRTRGRRRAELPV